FALLGLFGAARAFYNPARQAMVPNLVVPEHLTRALAPIGSVNKVATISGPLAGGLLYGLGAPAAYGVSLAFFLAAAALIAALPAVPQRLSAGRRGWSEILAGVRFIRRKRIILGAISLDLFVVLLGGAVALLPVYARDVLAIGAVGLGLLRAAPAAGAILVALVLMNRPIARHAGTIMFAAVAGFALFTLVFALSKTVWLSILALALAGGCDMVSVLIRSTLVQLHTPDELRGRVNAVNMVFIGASNELGGFRAGTVAALVGPIAAIAGGAVTALGICALWYRAFPELREASRLDGEDGPLGGVPPATAAASSEPA
ncbi:MAG: MFS transporter, partial [Inquilinus sp.]|nr:MFS transporter [Inquilinus sp.]